MVSIFSYRSVHGCMWTVAPARLASSASPIRKIELLGIVTIVQTYGDIRTDARFFLSTTSTTTTLPCGIVWYPGLERPHESVWHLLSFVPLAHWNDPQSQMHLLRLSSIYIGVCWSMHFRGYRVWRLQVLPAGAFCLAAGTHEHLGFGFLICTLAAVYPKHQTTSSRFIVGKQQSIAKLWSCVHKVCLLAYYCHRLSNCLQVSQCFRQCCCNPQTRREL